MPFTRAQSQKYLHVVINENSKWDKTITLDATTVDVQVPDVADFVQSSLSLHPVRQPNSRGSTDRSLLRRCWKNDWVVLCQTLQQSNREEEWTEMHGKLGLKERWRKKRRPESGRMREVGLERVAERRILSC